MSGKARSIVPAISESGSEQVGFCGADRHLGDNEGSGWIPVAHNCDLRNGPYIGQQATYGFLINVRLKSRQKNLLH
jgi:hypothetical protein